MFVYLLDRAASRSESFISREFDALKQIGVEPKIFALRGPKDSVSEILPSPISINTGLDKLACFFRSPFKFSITLMKLLFGLARHPSSFLPQIYRAGSGFSLVQRLRRLKVTHIHAQFGYVTSTVAYMASQLADIDFSMSVHAWDIFVNRSLMPQKLKAAKFVITCTDYARDWLLSEYPFLNPAKVITAHHGLDATQYTMRKLPPPSKQLQLMSIGRLVPKKGYDIMLNALGGALKVLSPEGYKINLAIAGDGPLKPALEQQINKLGLEEVVTLKGRVSEPLIKEALQKTDIFLMSSVRTANNDSDGLPNVILEAMSSGACVIAPHFAGIPEAITDDKTGILFESGNTAQLQDAIISCVKNYDTRSKMAISARARVEDHFSLKSAGTRIKNIFDAMGL